MDLPLGTGEFIMPDMTIPIDKLVRSKRRTIALIVEPNGSLTVRAPKRAALRDIKQFIIEKTAWIQRTRQKIEAAPPLPKKEYRQGEGFLFLGRLYPLHIVGPQRPALKFENAFTLSHTAAERAESLFIKWYKQQALQLLSARVGVFSAQFGLVAKQVKISSAKTRWGSCSADGTLNFSWRLILAPLDVVDYVVIHELAHLRVKNHSQQFWLLVEQWMPDYQERRKWLRLHGGRLSL